MKVLVTGGAGFIGSNIVRRLVDRGDQVTVIDNLQSGYAQNLDPFPTVNFIHGDIRSESSMNQAMEGIDVVFHLAASVGNKRSIDMPMDDAETNVLGTIQVLEAMRKHGAKRIVASSSAGIFGELKTLPIAEQHQVEPDSPYGATKLAMEKLCLAYAKLYDMDAVCLRYFNVFGPNQRFDAYGNVIPIFVFKMLRGEGLTIFGDGEQTRDFIHVDDVVQANLKGADAPKGVSGAFNLGSGERISINNLVKKIQELAGREVRYEYGPPRAGDVRDSLADFTKATKELGFKPQVEFNEGLRNYIQWAEKEAAQPVGSR
ncbi:MAG: SDR family NAD(P)-dependent oxidoreductase [Armatimonadetes bacterium]|nr:SDR family NAD(P)-dependent oxidoreductase [Armatimonadota bacterium]